MFASIRKATRRAAVEALAVVRALYQCQDCQGWFESDTPFSVCSACMLR